VSVEFESNTTKNCRYVDDCEHARGVFIHCRSRCLNKIFFSQRWERISKNKKYNIGILLFYCDTRWSGVYWVDIEGARSRSNFSHKNQVEKIKVDLTPWVSQQVWNGERGVCTSVW